MKESDQKDHRVLRSIKPVNLLSFGPETPALELETLNVLIGPNGSGKSNLIEALALMRATPVQPQTTSKGDVRGVLRRGGGSLEWIWKGAPDEPASPAVLPGFAESLGHRMDALWSPGTEDIEGQR